MKHQLELPCSQTGYSCMMSTGKSIWIISTLDFAQITVQWWTMGYPMLESWGLKILDHLHESLLDAQVVHMMLGYSCLSPRIWVMLKSMPSGLPCAACLSHYLQRTPHHGSECLHTIQLEFRSATRTRPVENRVITSWFSAGITEMSRSACFAGRSMETYMIKMIELFSTIRGPTNRVKYPHQITIQSP